MKLLIGGALMFASALLTSARVPVYHDNLSLWADARIHAPEKPRPYVNLAVAMINAGEYDSADAVLTQAATVSLTRGNWERDHADDMVIANRAVIQLREGHQLQAALLLHDADSTRPAQVAVCQIFELCRNSPHSR